MALTAELKLLTITAPLRQIEKNPNTKSPPSLENRELKNKVTIDSGWHQKAFRDKTLSKAQSRVGFLG